MAEQTLLQIVQTILASLDSDEVNSISDTAESRQVAQIVQNKYFDICARGGLPEHKILLQLSPSTDPTKPVLMFVPAGVSNIDWIKYFDTNPADGSVLQVSQFGSFSHGLNLDLTQPRSWTTISTTSNTINLGLKTFTVSPGLPAVIGQSVTASIGSPPTASMSGPLISYVGNQLTFNSTSITGTGTSTAWTITGGFVNEAAPGYIYVTILPIDQFIGYVNRLNPLESDVGQFQFTERGNNFTFYYKNSSQPRYCTVIENTYVVFDSYDATQDTTLQASKTLCYGQIVPPFQLTDNFVPDFDDQQFPLLLNESKALAYMELKQMPHPKADQEIKRQWSSVQKNKSVSNKPSYFGQLPDFGRVPRTGGFSGGGWGMYKWMRQAGP